MKEKTVFIVDDDMTNLTIGANELSACYNVFTFSSGELVLKRLERQIPDMILLDVDMPLMNGYEVIKEIKSIDRIKNIPIIFLTAKSDSESELEGLSLGAIDYIMKPFSPPLLRKRIEVHLLVESQKKDLQNFNDSLLDMVDAKTKEVVELQEAVLNTMSKLIDCRDDITGGHIERTKQYMKILLAVMQQSDKFRQEAASWDIKLAVQSTQLHDVGKIMIRDDILLKPDKLTDDEYELIKKHALYGENIIAEIQKETTDHKFLEYAKIFAGTHHEKWDGSGYPRGLEGDKIPLLGKAMAVADVYDALISDRPYKKAFTHREAVTVILAGRETQFDPLLVDLFLAIADEFDAVSARA